MRSRATGPCGAYSGSAARDKQACRSRSRSSLIPARSGLPRLPVLPCQRAVPTTPADQNGCACRFLPRSARPSPLPSRVGIRIATFEACSGFTRYGPLARSVAQGDLCHKAPTCSVTQASRLSATRSNRLLSRWNLPPLATRADGAHWAKAHRGRRNLYSFSCAFAHAVRPRRLTAWAKSRKAGVPCRRLRQATLPTL